ncbi:MAG: acetolactate synthase small subunit [Cohaesibacteraceae bacterium]|nr:acetolactate synthase small subunit [Cohaesibacteraceae bacterium]
MQEKHLSRMTIVTTGTPNVIEQIHHQLERLIPVHRVVNQTLRARARGHDKPIERELAMVKVSGKGNDRVEALRLAEAFRATVIDATAEHFVFEITGRANKIDQFISVMAPLGLVEVSRTGIAAVGRGSEESRAPRLIDFTWGRSDAPKVTLVGKGVCFDTGGLDIKSAAGMKLMKKDMGGAAHVLALASMIMAAKLDVRLRVLIPAVENSVSDGAMRPLDVVATRKGLTIEIGHTDAEGRVILADALALASEDQPELILDFATLIGAARVALGPDLPALFCNDDGLANEILAAGEQTADPMWRLPLHQPYKSQIKGTVADLRNDNNSPYAGAIMAGLFLESFVGSGRSWAHIDLMAWNLKSRPGRPEGGEALGIRALYKVLEDRYAQ